jgi:hypothetical protein
MNYFYQARQDKQKQDKIEAKKAEKVKCSGPPGVEPVPVPSSDVLSSGGCLQGDTEPGGAGE